MKIIKTVLLLSWLFLSMPMLAEQDSCEKDISYVIAKNTAIYYKFHRHEMGRSYKDFVPFADAAVKVAEWTSIYPARDSNERAIEYFSLYDKESRCHNNIAVVNVPNASYPGLPKGHRVKRLSIDYGSTGVNSINVQHTYEIAYCIQQGIPFPKYLYLTPKLKRVFRQIYIPKSLKLKRISVYEDLANIKKEYHNRLCRGESANYIRKHIKVSFTESTQDDRVSLLLYRVIVELERKYNGWSYHNYNPYLFKFLIQFVD